MDYTIARLHTTRRRNYPVIGTTQKMEWDYMGRNYTEKGLNYIKGELQREETK